MIFLTFFPQELGKILGILPEPIPPSSYPVHFNLAIFNGFLGRVNPGAGPPYQKAVGFPVVKDSL